MRLAHVLVALSLPQVASAYVIRRTDGGTALHWTATPKIWVDESLDPIAGDAETSRRVVSDAAATWAAIDGAGLGDLETGSSTGGEAGYDPDAASSNRSQVLAAAELPGEERDALAVTLVTYDSITGEIFDTDVLVRSRGAPFATDGASGHYDLPSVVTHELGHAFGLAHETSLEDATMYPETGKGDVEQRTLSADDVAGILAIYGPGGEGMQTGASVGTSCRTVPGDRSATAAELCAVAIALALVRRHG